MEGVYFLLIVSRMYMVKGMTNWECGKVKIQGFQFLGVLMINILQVNSRMSVKNRFFSDEEMGAVYFPLSARMM